MIFKIINKVSITMHYRALGCVLSFCFAFDGVAAVNNAFVSTAQDAAIIIDLSVSVSTEPGFSYLTVSQDPANGTALVSGVAEVTYTPNLSFNGTTDTFEYTAFDSGDNPLGSAIVTVSVGILSLANQNNNTASAAITNLLDTACIANGGSPSSPELVDLCSDFFNATDAERLKIANELAPREINGQNQLSSSIAAQQIDGIRRRLTAIRQGTAAINPINISFDLKRYQRFSFRELFAGETGGGASTDSNNSRLGVFITGNVAGGDYTPSSGSSDEGYEFSLNGFTLGSDYRLNSQTIVGAALGRANSGMDVNNNGGNLDAKGFSLIGYGSYYLDDKTYVESIVGLYRNDFTASRIIDYKVNEVTKTATASSEAENRIMSVSVGAGHELDVRGGATIILSANLDYIRSAVDGYLETGAGSANLSLDGRQETNLVSTLNLTTTYAISLPSGVFIPQLDLAWKHDFSNKPENVSGALAVDVANTGFSFETESSSSDYLKAAIGFSYVVVGGNTGFMYFENTFGRDDFSEYNISMGLRVEL